MSIQRFFGCSGLARFLGVSEARVRQLQLQPDAVIDGRPAWSPETAAKLKTERELRRAERQAGKGKRAATIPSAAAA